MSGVACAKCGADVAAAACPRCGLAVDAMATFQERDEASVAPALLAAWARVEAAWEDDARHEAFVAAASADGAYAWAARRYRLAALARGDDPRPAAMQARLSRMAETVALVGRRSDAPVRRPLRGVLWLVLLGVVVLAGGALVMTLRRPPPEGPRMLVPTPTSVPRTAPPRAAPPPGLPPVAPPPRPLTGAPPPPRN